MSFIRRHRVFVVLVALGVLVAVLVAERVRISGIVVAFMSSGS